jgi:hypothetical protein
VHQDDEWTVATTVAVGATGEPNLEPRDRDTFYAVGARAPGFR